MGHSVVGVVASGEEAIDAARRLHPDLVLMDVKLEGTLDGIETAARIRKDTDAAIVYLTAFADDETLQRAKITQPYGYILKPFHERELHVVIEVSMYRQGAERSLRESEIWREALIRSIGDAVVASNGAGRVKFMNPLAGMLTGWSEAEAIGRPFEEVIRTARLPERRRGAWRDSTRTNLIAKDGSERPVELELTPIRDPATNDTVIGTLCVFCDASERLRLRDRQRFLAFASSELASTLDRDVVLTRIASLIARSWSDWCVIHVADKRGRLRVGAIAHRDASRHAALSTLSGAAVLDPVTTIMGNVVQTGASVLDQNIVAGDWPARRVGIELPVAASSAVIVPLRARNQVLGTLTAVSERREHCFDASDLGYIDELGRRIAYSLDNAQLYADARRATTMRDDVLAIVSHDLRNPLSTISIAAEQLLFTPGPSPQRVEANATSIRRNSVRMARLIDDLLDVGRVDTGRLSIERQPVSARTLVDEALVTFEALAADRSIRFESASLTAADCLCDHDRVLQVLSNLISNALKFSPDGGAIRVDGDVRAGWFEFSVADQGTGISPDQLERVFERYWQAPEARHRGSGLGLYIARGIVEAHGGNIWAESRQPNGTTFHFTIPLAAHNEAHLPAPT